MKTLRFSADARRRTPPALLFCACLVTLAIGLGLLSFADASGGVFGLSVELALTGGTFLAILAALILTSMAMRMQVCFQLAYIYFAIYMLLPGYNHLSINTFPFFAAHYPEPVLLEGAAIVSLFCVTMIGTHGLALLLQRPAPPPPDAATRPEPNLRFAGFAWLALILSLGFFLAAGGLRLAFSTRGTETMDGDSAFAALALGLPRVVSAATLAYAIGQARLMRNRASGWLLVAAFLLPSLVLNFPAAIPRSALFGLLLFCAFAIINFRPAIARTWLSLLFLFGAVIAMPVSDALVRGGQSVTEIRMGDVLEQYFQSGDFDGLQSLNNVVILKDKTGLQYGHHLLSSVLFFVPRSIWPGKAKPTGSDAADAVGFSFNNVSEPLPGEFFADFGYPGVFVGAVLVALFMVRLDRWIDRNWAAMPSARFIAGAFVGYSTPIFRGSLEAVIAPVALLLVASILVHKYGFRLPRRRPSAARPSAPRPSGPMGATAAG